MSDVQIFISYARDDDAVPPHLPSATGFVTFLHGQLAYAFQRRGPNRPRIWRDTESIERADQFEERIENAIQSSSILLVVLSPNWMSRPYCLRELESFARRWRHEGELALRKRIVVVAKRHVDLKQRPSELQGQEGFAFYAMEGQDRVRSEYEFFGPQGPQDARYWGRLEELADNLLRPEGPGRTAGPAEPSNGRTVYVAQPATDMRKAYDRFVIELQQRGFAVLPDPAADLLYHPTARSAVEAAISASEVSIHLLGESHGPSPEGERPIADLQLACAATAADGGGARHDLKRFRRIIWSPKVLDDGVRPGGAAVVRDPMGVLANFGPHVSTDKVEGGTLSDFVNFLLLNLDNSASAADEIREIKGDARVYVSHGPRDRRYAVSIAKVLQERAIEPILPARQGGAAERAALHRRNLLDCDAVVLCWASASEVWAKVSARELKSWRQLGRTEQFGFRGLVLGPPPDETKSDFAELPPRSEIDVVLDLTKVDQPEPEILQPLFSGARPDGR